MTIETSAIKITERTITAVAGDLSAVIAIDADGMPRLVRFTLPDTTAGTIGVSLEAEKIERLAALLETMRRDEGHYDVEVCPAHGYWRRSAYIPTGIPTGRPEIDKRLGFVGAQVSAFDRCPGCYPPALPAQADEQVQAAAEGTP